MKKIPRVPRPLLGNYRRPGSESLVNRAGAKRQNRPVQPSGRRQASDTDEGWATPPRHLKTKKRVRTADNPTPEGYAPTGRHRSLGTAQTTHRGRRRAAETGYEGRHRKEHEGRHRSR